MTAHLLILYPTPKDAAKFDRAYRDEHLPYAKPKLISAGAAGVTTQRVVTSCRPSSGRNSRPPLERSVRHRLRYIGTSITMRKAR